MDNHRLPECRDRGGRPATLVVDTGLGNRNGEVVAQAALRLSPKGQKLYLTTTHFHPEHASGEAGFPEGTVTIRPAAQEAELEADGARMVDAFRKRSESYNTLLDGVTLKPASILFDRSYSLDLGQGVKAVLFWYGAAHTKGDELVMVDPDSVLISGDVVQNKTIPNFTCAECTPSKWRGVLDEVTKLRPRLVVPDHSPPGDGIALVAAERAFLQDLQDRTGALKKAGTSLDDSKRVLANEFGQKYADWASLDRLPGVIERSYNSQ